MTATYIGETSPKTVIAVDCTTVAVKTSIDNNLTFGQVFASLI